MNEIDNRIEKEIDLLLEQMTLEEKVALCHANTKFTSTGVERLGIEDLTMSDGPHGVRGEIAKDSWESLNLPIDLCTYLPTGTALAATWNPDMGRRLGEVLGSEARYRGKDVILGPGVNIIRTPLCGRNFEYMSEDPCLIQKMAPSLVKGIQSQDTAACVKHYALNNQELDRFGVNVELSRRALHEIYLKGFYSAIIEGDAATVMGAYNKYQKQYCCHNDYLINKVLKGDWGYKGAFITDWGGAHNTDECIFNGLDIEMGTYAPYNRYYLADAFLKKAQENEEARACLEDKARRVLRTMLKINKLSKERNKGEYNTPEHQRATADIAAEAMVLLKNNGILPLEDVEGKKILVVGHNAVKKHADGGGSSGIRALYEITPLEGINNYINDNKLNCQVEYVSDLLGLEHHPVPVEMLDIMNMQAGCRSCVVTEVSDGTENIIYADNIDIADGAAEKYHLVMSLTVPESGIYSIGFSYNCGVKILVGNEFGNKIEDYYICPESESLLSEKFRVTLTGGEPLNVDIWLDKRPNCHKDKIDFSFGWITPSEFTAYSGKAIILEKAAAADIVVYCAALGHSYDTEMFDRENMCLPTEQQILIPELIKANPNTVITVTAGAAVEMPWISDVGAVLWTWYAGMESGNVLAKILFGDICPSGKMPFTMPYKYEEHPVARYGEYKSGSCKYNEDIMVGYRGFDIDGIEPMFAFGHGLSYSSFEYSNIGVETANDSAEVSFDITNVGDYDAYETAQLYIGDPVCSVVRPVRELRNFQKVFLKKGETKRVSLSVTKIDLSFYDETSESFVLERGEFVAEVGASSRDIRLKRSFTL